MQSCPECNESLPSPRPVLCPRCGFPLALAEKDADESGGAPPAASPPKEAPQQVPRKPRGPRRSGRVPWSVLLVPVAAVLAMVLTSTPQMISVTGQSDTEQPGEPDRLPANPLPGAQPASEAMNCPGSLLPVENGLTSDAVLVLRCVKQRFPQIQSYGGVGDRPANVDDDHQTGRALDIMIPGHCAPRGQEVIDYLYEQQKPLGVKYLIWCDQIWSVRRSEEGWRPYWYRGPNDTLAHRDHVHVSVFGNGAGGPPVTMPPPPRLPSVPPDPDPGPPSPSTVPTPTMGPSATVTIVTDPPSGSPSATATIDPSHPSGGRPTSRVTAIADPPSPAGTAGVPQLPTRTAPAVPTALPLPTPTL